MFFNSTVSESEFINPGKQHSVKNGVICSADF